MYYPQIEMTDREMFTARQDYYKEEPMSFDLDQISESDLELFKEDFLSCDNTQFNYSANAQFNDILPELSTFDKSSCNQLPQQLQRPDYDPYLNRCSFIPDQPSNCGQCPFSQASTRYPATWSEQNYWSYPMTHSTTVSYSKQTNHCIAERRSFSVSCESCPSYMDGPIAASCPSTRGFFCSAQQTDGLGYSQFGSQDSGASYLTSSTPSPANANNWEHWSFSSGQSSPNTLDSWSPQPTGTIQSASVPLPATNEARLSSGHDAVIVNKKGTNRKRKERKLQLWEFILNLLNDPLNDAVEWVDQPQGLFRVVSQESLVQSWSTYRNRGHMTFEKLTRTLRFYYPKGFLTKIHGKHNLYKYQYSRLPKPTIT